MPEMYSLNVIPGIGAISTAPAVLAEEALALKAGLIHYSTDYVFDGAAGKPYTEVDLPRPLNVYGQSKLAGEMGIQRIGGAYLILRTSWVYSTRQGGFLNKVLQWARQQRVLQIVSDQISGPTWCRMLAEATAHLTAMGLTDIYSWMQERHGLYHLAGSGYASRLEWAKAIIELDPRRSEHIIEEIQPALTADFPVAAQRPLFTPLDCSHFESVFGFQLPHWRSGLELSLSGC
jgi:dTDP-4-dehydrorhamnose reductase